jgi:predicted SAM-dependent methyltransferase
MTDTPETFDMTAVNGAVTRENLHEPATQDLLRRLSLEDREAVALASGTMVQYYGEEVAAVREAEEVAALRAMPPGYAIEQLNGINVGCGDRRIHPALLGVDAHKGTWHFGGRHITSFTSLAHLRGWAGSLPFRPESIDFIVALHVLEHEADPVATVRHWLDVVKPGGGVGIVVPDWRYTWDARRDQHPWSHRWNPTPSLLRSLHARHWAEAATLEHVDTYPFRLSFDVVLRKHGTFTPFDEHAQDERPTGYQLHCQNAFLHEEAA